MWKSTFVDVDNTVQRTLGVSTDGAIVDMGSLFSCKNKPIPSIPTRHQSKTVPAKGLMNADPSEWTEYAIYEMFSKKLRVYPHLDTILEMNVRIQGGHKFLCKFLNAKGMECVVWVGDVQLARVYPKQYSEWKVRFGLLINR